MRKFAAFLILIVSFCAFATAQTEPAQPEQKPLAPPNSEIFGGYAFEHAGLAGSSAPSFGAIAQSSADLHGFDVAYSHYLGGFLQRRVGFTLEVGRVSSQIDIVGDHVVRTSFLGGPTVRLNRSGFLTTSVHVLGGVDRQSLQVPNGLGATINFINTEFAIASGGTVDANLSRRLAVRLAQVDYLYTNHYSTGQSSFRYSGGIVIRF